MDQNWSFSKRSQGEWARIEKRLIILPIKYIFSPTAKILLKTLKETQCCYFFRLLLNVCLHFAFDTINKQLSHKFSFFTSVTWIIRVIHINNWLPGHRLCFLSWIKHTPIGANLHREFTVLYIFTGNRWVWRFAVMGVFIYNVCRCRTLIYGYLGQKFNFLFSFKLKIQIVCSKIIEIP